MGFGGIGAFVGFLYRVPVRTRVAESDTRALRMTYASCVPNIRFSDPRGQGAEYGAILFPRVPHYSSSIVYIESIF